MMKKSILYIILFGLTIVLLALPTIQMEYKILELKPLKGSTNHVEVKFDFDSYRTNAFQSQVNDYLRYNFGFRELLIRFYNQYTWDFYKKYENKSLFFGKDNWLFFYDHLHDHFESRTYVYANSCEEMAAIFDRDAKMTYFLQEILKEFGISLYVCFAPSKDQLYPEYLPDNIHFGRTPCPTAYDYYKEKFDELGVNYFDYNALYKELKGKVDYPLFYKSSSHYSIVSATYQTDTLIRYMENLSGMNLLNLEYGEPYVAEAKATDRDMENLLNLMRPIEKTDYLYVDAKAIPDSTTVKPRWLIIGDSFVFNIISLINREKIFNRNPFWYYNKEIWYDNAHKLTDDVDLLEELLKSDIVTLYWCPINLYELEHNFVIKAIEALCFDDYCDKNELIEYIKTDQEWYNSIVEKAKRKEISVDEMLSIDANHIIEMRKEEKEKSLKGDGVPTCGNKRIQEILKNK